MRSRIISLVIVSTLLLVAVPSVSQAQDVVTLKYHTWYPPQSALQPIIDQFQKDNPNIKVELDVQESTKYQQSLPLSLNSGEALDVVGVQSGLMVEQIRANLQPIDPLFVKYIGKDWQSQFVPANLKTAEGLASDGVLYFLPLGRLGSAVGFYNGAIFDELGLKAPQTYADLVTVAKTIRAKKPDRHPMVFPAANWCRDELALTIVGQDDPNFFNNIRYKHAKWVPTSYIKALTEYKQMYTDGVLSLDNQDILYDKASEAFATSKAAMYFNGTLEAGLLSQTWRNANKY